VDRQTFRDYEHVIWIDSPEIDVSLFKHICGPQREIYGSAKRHGHFGNYSRARACEKAQGEYLIWLDDDNFLANCAVLQSIDSALAGAGNPPWALFPIHRHGSQFLLEPPGMCQTDSANMVVKREIGAWPDIECREADGVLAERLKSEHEYVSFPLLPSIIVMEKSSNGE